MIAGALRGKTVEQYPGEAEGREREIVEGTRHSVQAITTRLIDAVTALERDWLAVPEDAWNLPTVTLRLRRSISEGVSARWREVEIHHADLGADYSPADWPAAFVDRFLERTMFGLLSRALSVPHGFLWQLTDRDSGRSWLVNDKQVTVGADSAAAPVTGSA
jgi:maleylpyruvate isomerase